MADYKTLEALSADLTALIEASSPWVVSVGGERGPGGSGVLWDKEHVVTAEHGLGHDDQVEVGLDGGKAVGAAVLGRMPGWDLALLRLAEPVEGASPTWCEEAAPGLVVSLGRQARGSVLLSLGVLSGSDPELSHRSIFSPKMAGGPLLNCRGEVLGLNLHGRPPEAVPYRRLKEAVEELKQGRSVEPSFLGLGLLPLEQGGCLVIRVEPGSPAEKGRLMVGDQLGLFNGVEVHSPEDVRRELRSLHPGRTVTLALARAGQALEVEVVLEGRPQRGGPDFPRGGFPPGDFGPGHGPPGGRFLRRIRHILHHGPPEGPPGYGGSGESQGFGPPAGPQGYGPAGGPPHGRRRGGPPHDRERGDSSQGHGPEMC